MKICRFCFATIGHDFIPICEVCSGQYWGQLTSSNGHLLNFEKITGKVITFTSQQVFME